jgi:hypothetical protein
MFQVPGNFVWKKVSGNTCRSIQLHVLIPWILLVRVFATAREAVGGVHRRTRGALVLVLVDERGAGCLSRYGIAWDFGI